MRRDRLTFIALIVPAVLAWILMGAAPAQQSQPRNPIFYSGTVTVQGELVEAGLDIIVCVGGCESYASTPVPTRNGGKYGPVPIAPDGQGFQNREMTFWIVTDFGRIQATQTPTFSMTAEITQRVDLTFTDPLPLPPPPTPMPTPLPTPVLPIPGDPVMTQIPVLAVVLGIAALGAGATMLFVVGRRRPL